MSRPLFHFVFVALVFAVAPAVAGSLDVQISDSSGRPAGNAVVALTPQGAVPEIASRLPAETIIDQRKETFLPLVSVVRKGGRVIFTNNDTTMHQVYSFSQIKQFELEVDEGHRSPPVVFDKPGVASIGCNIHDHMITYVYVAATPWAVLTDAAGHAVIADLPAGSYRVEIWHPQLVPGRPAPSAAIAVSGATKFALAVPLLSAAPQKHMHMGSY
jgi:plastocyanin